MPVLNKSLSAYYGAWSQRMRAKLCAGGQEKSPAGWAVQVGRKLWKNVRRSNGVVREG
jgi:hypothetical protein